VGHLLRQGHRRHGQRGQGRRQHVQQVTQPFHQSRGTLEPDVYD
jgi:hypothetical protein